MKFKLQDWLLPIFMLSAILTASGILGVPMSLSDLPELWLEITRRSMLSAFQFGLFLLVAGFFLFR